MQNLYLKTHLVSERLEVSKDGLILRSSSKTDFVSSTVCLSSVSSLVVVLNKYQKKINTTDYGIVEYNMIRKQF